MSEKKEKRKLSVFSRIVIALLIILVLIVGVAFFYVKGKLDKIQKVELNKEELNISDFYITPVYLKQIIDKINDGTISNKQAKEIFYMSLESKKEPVTFISKDNAQISNKEELLSLITEIIKNNASQVEQYKSGKTNLFDYFVGQVMKSTRGKANPVMTKEILNEELNK